MKTLLIVLLISATAWAETNVHVFSSALVTETNKNGKGTVDIDTPEGAAIFGGAEAVAKYKDRIADSKSDKEKIKDLEARIKKLEER